MPHDTSAFRTAEKTYLESLGIDATERWAELPRLGIRARWLEVGEGPPVVMVHGGGGLGAGWAPLVPHLPGRRLLLVDRPGFGLTDLVDYRGVDLRRHAIDFLADVLDVAEIERTPVVANSMGALWSLWLAGEHPDRVDRLALLGTPARILETSAPGGMRLLGIPGLNRLLMALEPPSPKQVRTLWKRMGHDPEAVCTPEMIDLNIELGRLPQYQRAWLSLLENVLPFARVRPEIGVSEAALAALPHEILYIWGSRDPFGSLDVAQRVEAATPRGELAVIGTGHLPWLDEPALCGEAVTGFLDR